MIIETTRTSTRITKHSRKSTLARKVPDYNSIGRQSLRIAIQASLQLAQQSSATTDDRRNTTKASIQTVVSRDNRPNTSESHQPEQRQLVDRPARQMKTEILNWHGNESTRKGWYYIKSIVAEIGKDDRYLYLVEWEGLDPMTGTKWPNTWVKRREVNASAVKIWEKAKIDGKVKEGVKIA